MSPQTSPSSDRARRGFAYAPVTKGLFFVAVALAGLTGCAGADTLDEADQVSVEERSDTTAALTGSPGRPAFLSPEDETDIRVLQPPKLPGLPRGLDFDPLEAVEGARGTCRVNCCTTYLQKLWDPVRQTAVMVPVTICR